MTINDLVKEIKQNNPDVTSGLELIRRAYKFASNAHQGQKREDGEHYINHSLDAAFTLAQIKLDAPSIAAALLHDVVDDTPTTLEDIRKEFDKEIASLVAGVSKLGKIKYRGVERHVENLRKMFLAMAKDVRIIIIKLADRLHNMKTLDALPKRKQKRIASETLEIYAPIAHRLGIGKLKGELEDLAFPYVHPEQHEWLKTQIKDRFQEREAHLKKIKPTIEKKLKEANIGYIDIHARAKRYYSLYKKLELYNMDFSKIYDLMASRIIVPTIEDCYTTMGVLHKNWKPLPGRIKDYIAVPKASGYQSLHTTVLCIDGKITEFQIRTPQIHWEAEYGIAAHWIHPKKTKTKYYGIKKAQLEWIKELKNWQKNISKPREFLKSLKIDFFKYRIFILTPKGDVVNLPEGATPIDFAYQIHTELGHRCGGAKADGEIVPLSHPLYNGQIVEILAKKEAKPSQDWLKFVKTNYAKNEIKAWFTLHLSKKGARFKQYEEKNQVKKPVASQKQADGEIIVQRLPANQRLISPLRSETSHGLKSPIKIQGENNFLIKLAKCCNPVPGESILGYATASKGITVHYYKCHCVLSKKDKRRILPVSWKNAVVPQPTTLEILARDRIGLIKDMATILSKLRINMTNINATEPNKGVTMALITIEVANVNQLDEVQKQLKKIKGVWEVKRI